MLSVNSFVGIKHGLTRALRIRSYLALWIGHTVSAFGSSLHRLALAWWVMEESGSALTMGIVMICAIVPMVPFMLIGGAVADRFDRVRVLLYADIGRGALSGLLAFLMATDQLELWHVYVTATLFGVVDSFFMPAVNAVLPAIVPPEDRSSAISLRALSSQLASILGPMAAAAVISIGSSSLAFAIDAGTFVVSALAVVPLLRLSLKVKRQDGGQVTIFADIREGFAFVKREPWLWISLVAFVFITAAAAPMYSIGLTYIIVEDRHYDASVLGIVEGLASAGTVVAALWLGRRARLAKRGWVIYGWVILIGAVVIGFGLPISIYGIAGLAILGGFGNSVIFLVWTSLMQDRVPEEQFGRVSSIDSVGGIVSVPFGMAVIGWALDRGDTLIVCAVAGGVVMLSGALSLLHPKMREID
ncbi:MAG: MFS transporter [Kofleriaceae bacterium]|nr:MFS transporter [Kofleriaceae bacterium]